MISSGLGLVIGHQRMRLDRPEFFLEQLSPSIRFGFGCLPGRHPGGVCMLSLSGSVVGMGHSIASPYAMAGSVEKTGISL